MKCSKCRGVSYCDKVSSSDSLHLIIQHRVFDESSPTFLSGSS
jgi:hypothetical protein